MKLLYARRFMRTMSVDGTTQMIEKGCIKLLKWITKKTAIVFTIVYALSVILLPITVGEGWLEYPHPLLSLPIAAISLAISFLVGSVGAIVTIPLGLAVSRGLKKNVVPLISRKVERGDFEDITLQRYCGYFTAWGFLGSGFLGEFLGESLPEIKEIFVIPIANATIDLPWIIAIGCFSLAVGITEEATFRLFGVSALIRILRKRLSEKDAWHLAILVISVVFASFHILFVEFWSQQPISTFVRTLVSGVILGYLFKELGYEASVIAHASGNFLGFLTLAVV